MQGDKSLFLIKQRWRNKSDIRGWKGGSTCHKKCNVSLPFQFTLSHTFSVFTILVFVLFFLLLISLPINRFIRFKLYLYFVFKRGTFVDKFHKKNHWNRINRKFFCSFEAISGNKYSDSVKIVKTISLDFLNLCDLNKFKASCFYGANFGDFELTPKNTPQLQCKRNSMKMKRNLHTNFSEMYENSKVK